MNLPVRVPRLLVVAYTAIAMSLILLHDVKSTLGDCYFQLVRNLYCCTLCNVRLFGNVRVKSQLTTLSCCRTMCICFLNCFVKFEYFSVSRFSRADIVHAIDSC